MINFTIKTQARNNEQNRLIVKESNLSVLLNEVIGSSLTALSGNLVLKE